MTGFPFEDQIAPEVEFADGFAATVVWLSIVDG